MSNRASLDFGFDIGNVNLADDANNTYMKVKIGKSEADAKALKSIVEAGTGRTLNDEDHYVSFKVPAGANITELKEMVEGMTAEGLVEEVAGVDGFKWLMVSLKKANEEQEMGDIKELEAGLKEFFEGVTANAFLEKYIKTSHHFTEARAIAEKNNEKDAIARPEDLVSFSVFLNGISGHVRADMDHDFVTKALNFAKKFAPIEPEAFAGIKKVNNVQMSLALHGIDKTEGETRSRLNKGAWEAFSDFRESFEEIKPFVSILDNFRVFFILSDCAYMSLEVKAEGLSDYVKYFAPDEEA